MTGFRRARGRRRKWAIGVVTVLASLALAASFLSPPALLSLLDGLMGGGFGTEKSGSAIAFGSHGQRLDDWQPTRTNGSTLPVLIFWYGGGWVNGSRDAYAFVARAYARQGFIVVMPDYRKVPGVRFPAFLVDGAQAVRWTRDHVRAFGGDPDRIAVAEHSAGAYTVAMLTPDLRWLRAEGEQPGVIKAAVGLCGPYDFYPFTAKRAIDAMKGVADPLVTQPIRFARPDAAPMLLVSAGADVQVGHMAAATNDAKLNMPLANGEPSTQGRLKSS